MTRFVKSWLGLAATTAQPGARRRPGLRPAKELVFGLQCDRTGPTATVGHGAVPRLPRLHRPGEQQGRRRGLQDQGHRDRQRVQGAAGDRGARALQEGRRGARGPVRHAADRGAEQEARGGQDPRHLARLRHRARRPTASASPTPSRSRPATGRRPAPRWSSPRRRWAAASRARRSPTCSTTIRPARSRCRSSRISPRPRASSCAPSRCRRRASRWARRSSTSPAATSPTSSSPTCSAARRRSPSRS